MKKLLLALGLLFGLGANASAQCIAVGGVNTVPQIGVSCASESNVPTYAATSIGLIPGAAATDIACISGSASRVVRVQYIRVAGTGTAITVPLLIKKNASVDTGGTLALTTAIPVPYAMDSTNPAATATTQAWTANPTITDSAPGIIDAAALFLAATTTSTAMPFVQFDYAERNYSQAPILRGIAQQVCVNLNGTSPTALLTVSFKWTEQQN